MSKTPNKAYKYSVNYSIYSLAVVCLPENARLANTTCSI